MARRLATATLVLGVAIVLLPGRGWAAPPAPAGHIRVVKVSGLIDPINADLIEHSLRDARRVGALVLVVQLNSTGGVISDARARALATDVRASIVPVAVWVGGSGRPRAYGPAFALLRAAAFSGVAPGARVGDALSPESGSPDPLAGRSLSGEEAVAQRIVDAAAPVLGDFIVGLDGRRLAGGDPLRVADVVTRDGVPRRELRAGVDVTFSQLTVWPRILHGVASPNVAFSMLVLALALAVFEFYTAGIGIAAGTAVLFGAFAAYGLGVLPTHPWAVALVFLAMFGFAVDVQSGAPRVWTVIGTVALLAGGAWLYAGQSVSPWVLVVMAVLAVLFMVGGMPAMVRTRFSTPTVGRESLIGRMGTALSKVDPDGTVEIDGAPWRARTNRATPIDVGAGVRVAAIDGLVLEVEPEHGAARDARH